MIVEVRTWFQPWYYKFGAIVLSAALGLCAYEWVNWSHLSASDWGTWAGAIGTVATLAVTIWLATSEQRRRHRAEKDLALITITGLTFRIEIVKGMLNTVMVMMNSDVARSIASDYAKIHFLIAQSPIWTPEELVPLVGIPEHLAPRLAFAAAEINGLRIVFEMVASTPHFQDPTASANFNIGTLPRLSSPVEILHDTLYRCKAYMETSGFGEQSVRHR